MKARKTGKEKLYNWPSDHFNCWVRAHHTSRDDARRSKGPLVGLFRDGKARCLAYHGGIHLFGSEHACGIEGNQWVDISTRRERQGRS